MTEETINDIEEEWRSISGYPNYEVSNLGKVRNIKTGEFRKLRSGTDGYLLIVLCENSITKTYRVHRLVAQEFVEKPDNKPVVDHIDHNIQNNCINNLRWCSRSENQMNRNKQHKQCSSKYKGVCYDKDNQK